MAQTSIVARIQSVLTLICLMVIDIGPIPVTAMIGLYLVIFRPRWFKSIVDKIYD